jgi:hypothetical protein
VAQEEHDLNPTLQRHLKRVLVRAENRTKTMGKPEKKTSNIHQHHQPLFFQTVMDLTWLN